MADVTISYSEGVKGWPTRWSYSPEFMGSLNNTFFSFKDGQLWKHDSSTVDRNSFYGSADTSSVTLVFNEAPSEIKAFKTLELEGTQPWAATVQSFESDQDEYKQSTVAVAEFIEKEGRWHAHLRRDELTDTSSQASFGLGTVASIASLDVTLDAASANRALSIGDNVYRDNAGTGVLVGAVTAIAANVVTLDSVAGLSPTDFIYGQKVARIEGADIRGYAMKVTLTNSDTAKRELYAANSRVHKSHR